MQMGVDTPGKETSSMWEIYAISPRGSDIEEAICWKFCVRACVYVCGNVCVCICVCVWGNVCLERQRRRNKVYSQCVLRGINGVLGLVCQQW